MHDTSKNNDSHTLGQKIRKEQTTVRKMIHIYCEKKHKTAHNTLCDECTRLLDYSLRRLELCQFQEDKPTCRRCKVHCYNPEMRTRIRQVMRVSGPRMLLRTPILWIKHRSHDRDELYE
ncbi:MAG: nitrous oxide-stimulated promoter family protein [Candidatus Thorarchaeota archaeon]|nr:nitrous oxide-stimulated promoter family protein [Candidatus Thorarchaeota archaeon]